jgi:hypothetical protein
MGRRSEWGGWGGWASPALVDIFVDKPGEKFILEDCSRTVF